MNKTVVKIILSIIIFCVSIGAYYYPVYKKGYPANSDYLNLVEAKNYAASGSYMTEDANGTYLSSQKVKDRGVITGIPNPLTPIIYGHIFKYFGFNTNLPFFLSIILFSFFNVALFLLIGRLISVYVGFIAGITSSLMPVMVVGATSAGFYEWAMVFFIGALWLFLGSKNEPFKAGYVRIFFASILFALSALARNAFAISFIPFLLYDYYLERSFKRSLLFFIPFLFLFGLTLTPYSWLDAPNGYGSTDSPFNEVGHLFRDPYTYHFEKDTFIFTNYPEGKALNRYETQFLGLYGYSTNLKSEVMAYYESAKFYVINLLPIINIGGPLILGLMCFGVYLLREKNKQLLTFFCLWTVIWFIYLVYRQSGNWDHYMELILPIVTLSSLGLFELIKIAGNGMGKRSGQFVSLCILLLFMLHLSQSDKWRLFDDYRSSRTSAVLDFINSPEFKNVKPTVAVFIHPNVAFTLNYYSDLDVVYFNSQTVEEKLTAGKLKDVFSIYGIKTAFGYSSELSSRLKSVLKIPVYPYDRN